MFELLASVPTILVVLFCMGLILILIEAFIPGFGIAGLSGIAALAISVILAAKTFAQGVFYMLFVLVVVCILMVLFIVFLSKGRLCSRLVLRDENSRAQGFKSSDDLAHLTGRRGRAETPLRPAGRVSIDRRTYDVVTDGEFIARGEDVLVLEVNGNQIIVGRAFEAV